jgi:hypothetical protein
MLDQAKILFSDTGIQITTQGERHLGAVVGNDECKYQYVASKVEKWIEDIKDLSKIAAEEPQAALSAFTKGICHRWSFVQRTISNISHLFNPLEECLRSTFIPSIIGRKVSDDERAVLSLPVRFGGMGIANPVEVANREYYASKAITQNLADIIMQQEQDICHYNHERTLSIIKEVKKAKESYLKEKCIEIMSKVDNTPMKRCIELNMDKGAGSWLTALPLQDHGFCLNKQEFRDAVCLRYGWKIPNTPQYCGCGSQNSVDHTLICKKGGYVSMRHNALRDLNAELQREVCKDVVVEPHLLPLESETDLEGTGTTLQIAQRLIFHLEAFGVPFKELSLMCEFCTQMPLLINPNPSPRYTTTMKKRR